MTSGVVLDRAALVPLICGRIAKGEPLAAICRDIGISRRTVNRWREEDEAIAEQMQDARDDGYDVLAQECIAIANTPVEGEETKYDASGALIERKVCDMLGHRKLQIETRLKLLAKWDPKRYGDKQQLEHTGPGGGPIQSITSPLSADELRTIAAGMTDKV